MQHTARVEVQQVKWVAQVIAMYIPLPPSLSLSLSLFLKTVLHLPIDFARQLQQQIKLIEYYAIGMDSSLLGLQMIHMIHIWLQRLLSW